MINNNALTGLKLSSELSKEYRPLLLSELMLHKQASSKDAPNATSELPDSEGLLDKSLKYGPSVGYGAGAGVLAGIPLSLLANALFGKDKSLRGHLRSALMGSILGGGIGALGGAGARYLYGTGMRDAIDSGIDKAVGLGQKHLGKFDSSGGTGFTSLGKKIKSLLNDN
jgi:hypothetical protein